MINRFSLNFKWALAAIVLTTVLRAQTGVGASPITMTARLSNDKVKVGQGVSVIVVLKNTAQEPFTLRQMAPLRDYTIEVTDAKGKPVERTSHGKRMQSPPVTILRNTKKTLSPGESLSEELELELAFVLTSPGTYSVSLSRRLADVAKLGRSDSKEFDVLAPVLSFSIQP